MNTSSQFNKFSADWPDTSDISENMNDIESMSRFVPWSEKNLLKSGGDIADPPALCCLGVRYSARDEKDAKYVEVWAPHLMEHVQKIWSVQSLNTFIDNSKDAFPFFFTIKEMVTANGKQYFKTSCVKASQELASKFPEDIKEIIARKEETYDSQDTNRKRTRRY